MNFYFLHMAEVQVIDLIKKNGITGFDTSSFNLKCSIRSIICLNLPSFSGGLDPWGDPSKNKLRDVGSNLFFLLNREPLFSFAGFS